MIIFEHNHSIDMLNSAIVPEVAKSGLTISHILMTSFFEFNQECFREPGYTVL